MRTTDSSKFQLRRRLERAKVLLEKSIKRIMELNKVSRFKTDAEEESMEEELRLLNRIADQQAQLIRAYESQLQREKVFN
jgi:hypothetical protein